MLSFKKQLIKSFINTRILSNKPGEMIIQSNAMTKIGEEFQEYDRHVNILAQLLDGIEEVIANYQDNTIAIKYDENKLTPQKVVKWVDIMIDIFIDNLEIIQQYWENNLEYVLQILEKALIQKLRYLNS